MDLQLDLYDTLELLKASYRFVDFRSALYKESNSWNRILGIGVGINLLNLTLFRD